MDELLEFAVRIVLRVLLEMAAAASERLGLPTGLLALCVLGASVLTWVVCHFALARRKTRK